MNISSQYLLKLILVNTCSILNTSLLCSRKHAEPKNNGSLANLQ
jgi:hypothetical protein